MKIAKDNSGCIRVTIPRAFPGSENPIFTRDGKRLIATGALGTPEERLACVWETSSGKLVKTLRHDSPVSHLALSPDEKHLAGGDKDGNLFVWNTETGEKLWFKRIHESRFTGLAFSPYGRLIASANEDRQLIVVVQCSDGGFELAAIQLNLSLGNANRHFGFWHGLACLLQVLITGI